MAAREREDLVAALEFISTHEHMGGYLLAKIAKRILAGEFTIADARIYDDVAEMDSQE